MDAELKKHSLAPEDYLPRIVDDQIEQYLEVFGAIEIAGTKWCGKTWTAKTHGKSIIYVDRDNNPNIVKADSSIALRGESPRVIDEWQRVPSVWDSVRHAVDDAGKEKGLWILTGSSTPHKDEVFHSGAGRIGRIKMLPMSLSESGDSLNTVSLEGLFNGEFESSQTAPDVLGLIDLACRGGWPEAIEMTPQNAQIIVREYLQVIYEQSIPRLGKSGELAERIVYSLARNLGQSAKLETIQRDALGNEGSKDELAASKKTISSYLEALKSLYLFFEVKGWVPAARSPKRVNTKGKRYFADPSIAVAALGMSTESLLDDWQTLGLIFENLCMRDLTVYARALPNVATHPVRYYRDDSGLEVDAIIEKADGSWGAFEIKLSEEGVDEAVNSLLLLKKKLTANPKAKTKEPAFMGVIVGTATYARKTPEGVYIIPARTLTR